MYNNNLQLLSSFRKIVRLLFSNFILYIYIYIYVYIYIMSFIPIYRTRGAAAAQPVQEASANTMITFFDNPKL